MMVREISRVILSKEGSEPLCSSEHFRYEETSNGILMFYKKSACLIPWHRIYEVEYVCQS